MPSGHGEPALLIIIAGYVGEEMDKGKNNTKNNSDNDKDKQYVIGVLIGKVHNGALIIRGNIPDPDHTENQRNAYNGKDTANRNNEIYLQSYPPPFWQGGSYFHCLGNSVCNHEGGDKNADDYGQ